MMSLDKRMGSLGIQCSNLSFLFSNIVVICYMSYKLRVDTLDAHGFHAKYPHFPKVVTQEER